MHNPQRYESESQAHYRERRAASAREVSRIVNGPRPVGMWLQKLAEATPEKRQRRALVALHGRRQYLKQSKQFKAELAEYAARHRPEWATA